MQIDLWYENDLFLELDNKGGGIYIGYRLSSRYGVLWITGVYSDEVMGLYDKTTDLLWQ